jgi:hypothetical protein
VVAFNTRAVDAAGRWRISPGRGDGTEIVVFFQQEVDMAAKKKAKKAKKKSKAKKKAK